ncbi:tRNA pseudouridine(55) synthase TruB [Candidatus Thioglobus sp.]|nr:tRNA pseudouridine(55) synthase TruB [Candidatus Thioglobus sp.]
MSKRNKKGRNIDGVLILDKASGHTSNAALQEVKRLFSANKAGHTGSLDPLASGLLPICLGQSTKVAQFLLDDDKRYFVRGKLGEISDTGDSEGEVSEYGPTIGIDKSTVNNCLKKFIGIISQVPPMYSALKKNGTPLYRLARKGLEVKRESRKVSIYEIQLISLEDNILTLEVSCSKGTYIRTLIEDIGKSLGCGGYVFELRRIGFAHLSIAQSITFEELQDKGFDELDKLLISSDEMLPNLKSIYLDHDQSSDIKFGRKIKCKALNTPQKIKLYDANKRFVGIGESNSFSEVLPKRLFT